MATSNFSAIAVATSVLIAAASEDPTAAVRNTEFNSAIDPLNEASHAAASLENEDGSIEISSTGQAFTLSVVLFSSSLGTNQGQIGVDATRGLYVMLGAGANVAAAGNHTHTAATDSVAGFISATDKTKLDGITAGATALVLAGTGTATTAAHSDHTHSEVTEEADGFMIAADKVKLDGLPTGDEINAGTVAAVAAAIENSSSIVATYEGGGLEFAVVLSTDLSANQGAIAVDAENGLYVVLGTGANNAAAGDHSHPIATESEAGFLSAADKTKLDQISGGGSGESLGFSAVPVAINGPGTYTITYGDGWLNGRAAFTVGAGSGGAYVANIVIDGTEAFAGALLRIALDFAASLNATVNIYDGSTGGNLLDTINNFNGTSGSPGEVFYLHHAGFDGSHFHKEFAVFV